MQCLPLFLIAVIVLVGNGCSTTSQRTQGSADGEAARTRVVTATVVTNQPTSRPVNVVSGRVIAVRPALQFVIVDFSSSRLPLMDQRLNVYRLDQKVAEIKISGPYLETTVAADITAGQVQEGDLVRDR